MIFEPFMTFLGKVLFFSGLVSERNSSFPKALTKDEEAIHVTKFCETGCPISKEILIKHNLRLVAHVVKKYNGAAEADDLISCGTIGLIKAINTFKLDRGTQVSTYAARCIENEILMFLRVTKKHQQVGSLSECFGSDRDGNDLILADIVADESDPPAEAIMERKMMVKLVRAIKERLNEREFKIISLRYGLENGISLPQREVAKQLDISRSYISRIEKHALEIIREVIDEPEFADFY